ncbi:hypothetical protein FLJC2902T_12220 [Flavobacterium limnosediminis JC2902]|uniref:CAAX prenyl protease 2/Lysostaphin resistance protein A-like domain-containing protein n=1 Tax=Flavobacterium limnosediminis JC2902 TaxID=1341181 RepID=V6SXR8_9FLAO|nr:CPBP family intramembrane glutamic endopeptidase [Flavobacterium limnosediminis]ESU29180.1 hypothetical protein FLJC2902T_12220 [Flavobacterium limnosediminis JC2902]
MLKKIANFRHNWIPVLAISLLAVFGLMIIFLDVDLPASRVSQFDGKHILVLMVFGSVVAPVLEEFSFRGFFSNNSKLKKVALVGFLSYTSLVLYSNYSIGFAMANALIFLVLITLYSKFKNNIIFVLFVITNAVVFGLIHYSAEDFIGQLNPYVLTQIAWGLLFTWITINSRLTMAMVFHGALNLVLLTNFLINLQFVSEETTVIEKDNVKISYQQVPVLDSNNTTVNYEPDKVIGKNTTIKSLLDVALYDSNLKGKYSSIVPVARYNFTIEFKDDKRNVAALIELLQEEEMVIKN